MKLRNPFRWVFNRISRSLERDVEIFETFKEHDQRAKRKHRRRRKKGKSFSIGQLVLKLTGASRIPASRRLVIGTYLAIMVFWGLIFLEAWHVALLHEPEWTLISGISSVVTFLAGTYWGRHA